MHAAAQNIYDVFMISPQLIINARIKNSISLKKITPPLHPRKLQPPPAVAPPTPPPPTPHCPI